MKRISSRAELEPIRVHDIRHSHVSLLVDIGFDIIEISRQLGYESTKTTMDTYAHMYPDKDMDIAEKLNTLRENKN